MIKRFRYQIILIIAIIMGFVVVHSLLNSYQQNQRNDRAERLNKVHSDAMIRARVGIDVYAAIVSSIRAFFTNTNVIPTEPELQSFLKNLLLDLEFEDDIVVSFITPDHFFKYVVTPTEIDAAKIKGKNVKDFRPESEVKKLDALMQSDDIYLFEPINLREGWVGLPFNFSVKDDQGQLLGYIAPVLNVNYLLSHFYAENGMENFVHSFQVSDSVDITREVVYDGTEIFNSKRDDQYYKNFDVAEDQFIYSKINVYNIDLKVGSAYKQLPKLNNTVVISTYIWYALLSIFSFIVLIQYVKNQNLTRDLKMANESIEKKNVVLEANIFKIQTLIKEIHHRVKNNMHMVASLLSLQQDEYDDSKIINALKVAKNRIQSMSLIHEKLYGSESLQEVNTKQYINQLIGFVEDTIGNARISPQKEIDVPESLIFDSQTMESLGLIINELITNSYKHAFKQNKNNSLKIKIERQNDSYRMFYKDSGPGLPEDFDIEQSDSLGMQLIHILAGQLKGHVEYSNDKESTFMIAFNEAEDVHA